MARRSSSDKSNAGMIVAIVVALASFAFLAWLPIRKGSGLCQLVGGLAIAGGLACIVWWVPTHEHPPDGLRILAITSGIFYVVALVLRVAGAVMPTSEDDVASSRFAERIPGVQTRNGEVVLFQGDAQFLGDKRVRAFGGISTRLGFGLRGGVGLSVPIHTMAVIDQGVLVVTNERIVLAGAARTTTLKPNRILNAVVDGDHVVVRPTNGKSFVVEVRRPGLAVGAIRSAMQLAR